MQAITVRYLGPTNHKPARIVATTPGGGRLLVSRHKFDAHNDIEDAAREVAAQLARNLGWAPCTIEGGSTKDAWVFVMLTGRAYSVTEGA